MSFEHILEKRGYPVQIIKIQEVNNNGIIQRTESDPIQTKAIVQSLSKEELTYWRDLGYAKVQLKAYFRPDESIDVGDMVEIDGKRYHIKTFENHTAVGINGYKVAILGEEHDG
ncbi:hypothetical protein [Archaeoglobus profundus]|uniref:Phage head-tail adaptor n=1 Tax=Archaeoglobus profundus (strain DSM 5631 / JCM 9629 / NBRC 100127 / Av18) TaxID=572546 RepID=D2REJ9_ARCPA|nr:hypothetical protein [Archaeoglobus profundus]ADB58543.1 hypothetical protein Arcpr_1496 [Archaeoglobus profundus DSM 5631]